MGGVALINNGHLIAEVCITSNETHSRRLMVIIKWLMEKAAVKWSDLDIIAVSLGPGSFTGLRIGITCAKALAFALRLPVIGVPTLDALASHVVSCKGDLICPLLDAKKSQIYTAVYLAKPSGELEKISPYLAIFPNELADFVPNSQRVLLLGEGLFIYMDIFLKALGNRAVIVPNYIAHVRAASVGIWAESRFQKEKKFDDYKTLKPIYVRLPEAEKSRLASLKQEGLSNTLIS
jgi:tRNA threonylcarbamoyladenosine biosynthesis protein TsaB